MLPWLTIHSRPSLIKKKEIERQWQCAYYSSIKRLQSLEIGVRKHSSTKKVAFLLSQFLLKDTPWFYYKKKHSWNFHKMKLDLWEKKLMHRSSRQSFGGFILNSRRQLNWKRLAKVKWHVGLMRPKISSLSQQKSNILDHIANKNCHAIM